MNKKITLLQYFKVIAVLAIGLATISCGEKEKTDRFISVCGDELVDHEKRVLVLNGINHVVKNTEKGYMHSEDQQLFKQFKSWGFNVVRYGIIWDGLEPSPNAINENYLKELDKRVKWAEENGLYLILDMHQDLFSQEYADGAPEWASLHDELPHITGDVWSDSYLISPAVHRCFDNFWKNKEVTNGRGVQDHYIHVWKTVAERYANSPSVIGFDVMNEPFMGSEANHVLTRMLEAYAGILAQKTGKVLSSDELLAIWGNEEQRIKALDALNDTEVYKQVMNHAEAATHQFEKEVLTNFYQRLRDTIRTVNTNHILFLEHNYFSNLGIKSTFTIPVDQYGKPDSLCVYAPHGYDLVTDTKGASSPGEGRVKAIFDQIFLSAKEKNCPVILGEWGAFYMGDNYKRPAEQIVSIVEEHKAGQTYWSWWPEIETQDYFLSRIVRIFPMNIAAHGEWFYRNYWENNKFECTWSETYGDEEEIMSRFYIPNYSEDMHEKILITPESDYKITKITGCDAAYLDIAKIGGARRLQISLK